MASSYSTNLRVELMANGENDTTWGTKNNTSLQMLEAAIAGRSSITHDDSASYTLTTVNGAADEARCAIKNIGGTLTAARNAVVPTVSQQHIVKNATTGGYAVSVKTSAGTGISVPNGKTTLLICDGTNVVNAIDYLDTLTAGTFGVRSSGSGAYDLQIANSENLTANRALTFKLNDAARTVDIAGNVTLAGAFSTSGAYSLALTLTGNTAVTLPTSGTLGITITAEQASTSGSSINFTSIPAWAKRIKVVLRGVGTNGTAAIRIQLGDSGGLETSGYTSAAYDTNGAGAVGASGFVFAGATYTDSTFTGAICFDLCNSSNTWVQSGNVYDTTTGAAIHVSSGEKTLTGTLDRLSVVTTNTFDAGTISVTYEP